jgi:bifunctional polynucleotide phosphatase/kinase
MIIFMGSPGSGKSTFYHSHLSSYARINQDQLGTKEKCISACQKAIAEKKSVVIDNLNQTKEQRSRYIPLAKAANIPVRLFYFETSKEVCMHNNKQRAINPHRVHHSKKVGSVIIHSFFKNQEKPTIEEGITEIKKIPFKEGPFVNADDEKIYH